MVITAVVDGKDVLEGYEIVLETTDRKEVEVTVAPDGKILEAGRARSSASGATGGWLVELGTGVEERAAP
jgi:hypothetical protein